MFKRGITPLIATVLLIGFTIILSLVVVNWTKSTIDDQTDNPVFDIETKNICLSAVRDLEFSFGGTSSSGFVIDIRNKGPNEFSSVMVLWKDVSGAIGDNSNSSVIVGFGSGSTTSNTGTEYKSVKVIPYVNELECNGFDVLMKPILNAFFLDFDTDFYGDPLNFVIEEIMPSGYVANSLDCSDENAYENPSENVPCNCSGGVSQALGSEICYNGFDDDCNGDENEDCPPVCRESNSDPAPFQGCFCGSNSTCSSPNYCCATGDYAGSCVDDCTSYVPT